MDFATIPLNAQAQPPRSPAREVDSPSARPTLTTAGTNATRRSQLFPFTVRLTPEQRSHFESVAVAQGHSSVAAAFKHQALSLGMEHPLREMRMSLEHMQERIADEGAWLQERIHSVSTALDCMDRHVAELVGEMQTCTNAMLVFARTNEALSSAIAHLSNQRPPISNGQAAPKSSR